jgi:hypothetical protein
MKALDKALPSAAAAAPIERDIGRKTGVLSVTGLENT